RHLAGVRDSAGAWSSLLLSRLGLRHGRALPGEAGRAAGQASAREELHGRRPEFPMYGSYAVGGLRLMPAAKLTLPCNWLQVKDNSMDPVATAFLHARSSGDQFTAWFGGVPELDW